MPFFDLKATAKPKDENNDSRIIMLNGKKVRVLGIRRLTPTECARLQTIPEWYDWEGMSDSQRYRVLGNGWTVSVIKHFFSFLPKDWFGDKAEPVQDEQPIINQQQG